MKLRIRKKEIPSGEVTEVQTTDVWVVSWYSRHGAYSTDFKKEFEAFIIEKEAKKFKKELRKAFKLLKFTYGTNIKLEKQR